MAEENKNGLSETLEKSANAASAIRGAIKTGKALSGAAKGAAAGGPYGAAAGALWDSRKFVGKVIIALIALLMLPAVFTAMLPSLIFGGIRDAFSPADPAAPVLNSSQAISANINDIFFCINTLLGEGQDDAEERIRDDFSKSGADGLEIVNPYMANPVYNANQFICQYCAAMDRDIKNISLSDMEKVLQDGREHLFSYTVRQEEREETETDAEGNETAVKRTWRIYTLVYNGEGYFADSIFHLTDEQKALAENYAENLSLFLEDGMFQVLSSWNGNVIPSLGDVTFTDGATPVVYYNQLDERYANEPYGTDNVGGYGCGPTAMAIVVSSLTESPADPAEMAEWSYQNGYWCKGSGSYHALIPAAAESWGLPVSGCSASEPQRILDALAEGKLVVAIMSKGHFTSSGHFIVLRGVSDEKIMVADPASTTRSGQLWDLSIILKEASRQSAAGGPFWIIG